MASKLISIIFSIAILLCQWEWANAELFTAIAEVEPLLETHKRIIDDLDFYIEQEEKRLSTLKSHLKHYKREHEIALQDIPDYLGNPINVFTLIKRLTTELHLIRTRIKKGTENIKNITMNHPDVKYPTFEDVKGAAHALTRLQVTYQLDTHDLAEGMLNGVEYGTPMTADDCYELGKAQFLEADYKNAIAWMTEAYKKYDDEAEYSFAKVDIVECIGLSYFLSGDTKTALEWTYTLLAIDPTHARALLNLPYFKKAVQAQENNLERQGSSIDSKKALEEFKAAKKLVFGFGDKHEKERVTYEALCRGEMDVASEISKNVKCFYTTDNHPFLRYAPIKTEQVYIQPDVFIFHEVLSDSEIEFIKATAMPRLQRATVFDPVNGNLIVAKYRISKSAWLRDDESVKIAKISQRVKDMTGLSMDYAENLQVVNYGIGGHYDPHFDFTMAKEMTLGNRSEGQRIATVLFYMSEVAQGGATVFTELGLSLFPIKGAAAFWLNLHPSGEGDMATRHAACPVLRGSKWVSNKWMHLGGQEFLKPCTLVYQAEGIAHRIPRPISKTSR